MTTHPTPDAPGLPELPASFGDHCVSDSVRTMREPGYTTGQMRDYGRACYEAALSARPLPSDWVADDGRAKALHEAVAALYFSDNSDYESALWQVVGALNPAVRKMLEDDAQEAFDYTSAMLAAAPSAPAEVVQTAPEPLAQGAVACHRVRIKGDDKLGPIWRDGDIPESEREYWEGAGSEYYIERAYHTTPTQPGEREDDTRRLDWLESREFDLSTRREDIGEDEYAIWWFVVDSRLSTKKYLHTVSGHPLGSPREAIDAAMKANTAHGAEVGS